MSEIRKKGVHIPSRILRATLICCGTFFVIIGFIGIFIPLLPTTPFLLLAAGCYARSSKRFYNWLLSNKFFGNHIKNYREKKGISIRAKAFAIILLWMTICYSIFVLNDILIRVVLIIILAGVTFHLLTLKTLRSH